MNVRKKGHQWERSVRLSLLKIFPNCITSRLGSQLEDSKKIDLMHTGNYAIQAKNYKTYVDFSKILKEMDTEKTKIIAFKHNKHHGKMGELAILKWSDFVKLLDVLQKK